MLRPTFARASKLAALALSALAVSACAHALDDPFGQGVSREGDGAGGATTGCDGTHSTTNTSTTSSGRDTSVTSTSSTDSGWPASTTTSGGSTCDSSLDCGTCADCAIAGVCTPQMNACQTDQDCLALLDCLSACQDQTCADTCATQYPGGQQTYMNMVTCVLCQACTSSCANEAVGACGP